MNYGNPMAHRPIGLCGMGKGWLERKGLVEGHTPQAKEMSQLVAPFRAHREQHSSHHATRTYGPRAVVLPQVKAAGLVQAFDLLL